MATKKTVGAGGEPEDILKELSQITKQRAQLERREATLVRRARNKGYVWEGIATASSAIAGAHSWPWRCLPNVRPHPGQTHAPTRHRLVPGAVPATYSRLASCSPWTRHTRRTSTP